MGNIITFYSFKGGVGRTMALANIGVVLARQGFRTLLVDWDLEAPGLEAYLRDLVDPKMAAEQSGVIDLLTHHVQAKGVTNDLPGWRDLKLLVKAPGSETRLHLLTAGKIDVERDYYRKVSAFDAGDFYRNHKGSELIESWRNEWKENYDFVLIDSRTGITDGGGICTIQMPDILAAIFTPNHKSLEGVLYVAKKALAAQQKLPVDRQVMRLVPIVSRFDVEQRDKEGKYWLELLESKLADLYADWVPKSVVLSELLEITKIPYNSFYSFGEKLAVGERPSKSPGSLPYTYETLAGLLGKNLEDVDLLMQSRDEYVRGGARQAETVEIISDSVVVTPEPAVMRVSAGLGPPRKLLKQHKRWVESRHKEGTQLRVVGNDFSKRDFSRANLNQAFFEDVKFRNADFSGADLSAASLLACDFSGATLRKADLLSVQADKAHFTSADMTNVFARDAVFTGANFQGAILSGANLKGASLREANLQGAKLKSAWLVDANLDQADLLETDLADADLSGASLRRAKMQGAYVGGAILTGADLRDCDLREARGLLVSQLAGTNLAGCKLPKEIENGVTHLAREIMRPVVLANGHFILSWFAPAMFVLATVFLPWDRITVGSTGLVIYIASLLYALSGIATLSAAFGRLLEVAAVFPNGKPVTKIIRKFPVKIAAACSPNLRAHIRPPSPGRTFLLMMSAWAPLPVLMIAALTANFFRSVWCIYFVMWAFGPAGFGTLDVVWPFVVETLCVIGVIAAGLISYLRSMHILEGEETPVDQLDSPRRSDKYLDQTQDSSS